jgi:hypothetical protein
MAQTMVPAAVMIVVGHKATIPCCTPKKSGWVRFSTAAVVGEVNGFPYVSLLLWTHEQGYAKLAIFIVDA